MERYDYREAVCEDIRAYINDNRIDMADYADADEAYNALYDTLFTDDVVTGNASGSYTCNRWEAEENVCHNFDLLLDACREFCDDRNIVDEGAEWADVTIRCYLLSECLTNVLDDFSWEN